MLLALGFDSQFCILEALITGIVDNWPKVLKCFDLLFIALNLFYQQYYPSKVLRPRRLLFTAVMVVFMLLLGIPMITQGGIYVFQVDSWSQLVTVGHN